MFLRRTRGLLDLILASLCLWAALYHTPLGALARSLAGLTFGLRTSEGPLLAYYNGGVYGRADLPAGTALAALPIRGEVPPAEALAYGVFSAVMEEPLAGRARPYELARARHITPAVLESAEVGPKTYAKLLSDLTLELGSEEGAVVALFCGYEPARYALERAAAHGEERTLERIAEQLPPGFETQVLTASKAMMLGTAYALAWPVPLSAPMTSAFGLRLHPILGIERQHTGVDLSLRMGTPVRSAGPGRVRRASFDDVNGWVLTVEHGRGVSTSYSHNSRLLVREGQSVTRGELLAESGNTGRSTGPHLHYQVELGRVPVDPLRFRVSRPSVAAGVSDAVP